jgi:hypothetical protein
MQQTPLPESVMPTGIATQAKQNMPAKKIS